ncbi:hypothetical protein ATPR_3359 [Acetobacter tropicalis NBRC 101654]|uniref:Uncharacterized protein n=1 Tax=Acetobacter tropicalis NBRC 101654 TaxID=749388 RepID=F7VJ10_9PROT|nr:hypothetical protein ATPR_3359 [Acetobacter tropicalis NBRC 101654]
MLPAPPVLTSRHADPVTKTRSSSTNAPVCSGSGSPTGWRQLQILHN